MKPKDFSDFSFNIVRQRASPTEVVLESGHKVTKERWLFVKVPSQNVKIENGQIVEEEWEKFEASEYHGEHFLYVDPLYHVDGPEGKGHSAFMCTCGSPGTLVGPSAGKLEESGRIRKMVVCYIYSLTLQNYGTGMHADQVGRKKWT